MTTDAPFDPTLSSELVAEYVQKLLGGTTGLVTHIHAADEMFLYNLSLQRNSIDAAAILYYSKGLQIYQAIEDVARWRFGDMSATPSFLDFASGFGRVTRFLTLQVPPSRIWVSEVDAAAVRFQEDTFGVNGLSSGTDPHDFSPSRAFSMVAASSFFSHLPAERFQAWLARLFSVLEPGGVLLFSTHGRSLLEEPSADWSKGIVFRPESETARLNCADYGTSWVTEEFVRAAVARACGPGVSVRAVALGLCASQDLYVLVRDPEPALPPLTIRRYPRGELDRFVIEEDGTVILEGWASGAPGEPPPSVELICRSDVLQRSTSPGSPDGRTAWKFRFDGMKVSPDAVVRVEATSAHGLSNILEMGTLRPYLKTKNGRLAKP